MGAPVKQAEVPVAMHIASGVERRTNSTRPPSCLLSGGHTGLHSRSLNIPERAWLSLCNLSCM